VHPLTRKYPRARVSLPESARWPAGGSFRRPRARRGGARQLRPVAAALRFGTRRTRHHCTSAVPLACAFRRPALSSTNLHSRTGQPSLASILAGSAVSILAGSTSKHACRCTSKFFLDPCAWMMFNPLGPNGRPTDGCYDKWACVINSLLTPKLLNLLRPAPEVALT
jgi:hypothetical protein